MLSKLLVRDRSCRMVFEPSPLLECVLSCPTLSHRLHSGRLYDRTSNSGMNRPAMTRAALPVLWSLQMALTGIEGCLGVISMGSLQGKTNELAVEHLAIDCQDSQCDGSGFELLLVNATAVVSRLSANMIAHQETTSNCHFSRVSLEFLSSSLSAYFVGVVGLSPCFFLLRWLLGCPSRWYRYQAEDVCKLHQADLQRVVADSATSRMHGKLTFLKSHSLAAAPLREGCCRARLTRPVLDFIQALADISSATSNTASDCHLTTSNDGSN
jgi:hypothetical protein